MGWACHSISPQQICRRLIRAPPFRALHLRYPVESLEGALADGISTGHSTMPEFRLDPDQIGDVIAYLKPLSEHDADECPLYPESLHSTRWLAREMVGYQDCRSDSLMR